MGYRNSGSRAGLPKTLIGSSALVGAALVVVGAVAILGLSGADDQAAGANASHGLDVLVLLGTAGVCVWRAASRADQRLSWLLIGLGLAAWAVGDVAFWTVGSGALSFGSEVMYGLFYVGALAGVALLLRGTRWDLSATADLAVTLLGVSCLWSWLVLGHLAVDGALIAYPILDLAICAGALVLIARSVDLLDFAWLLLLAGFALIAAADSSWAVQTAGGANDIGGVVDALYPAGALLIGIAAWTNVRIQTEIRVRQSHVSHALASAAAMTALLVLVWDHFQRVDVVSLALAAITVLAVVGRVLLAHHAQFAAEARAGEEARRLVTGLMAAVDARDHRTQDHANRVAEYASAIAAAFGFADARIERLRLAARFHDIGKLAVPEEILSKPRDLTPEEFEQVKTHCATGEQILCQAGLTDVARWVRSHQEHWDGSGYPDGLAGDDIPLESRILTGADSLDAMTSDRPYRLALDADAVRTEVLRCSGTQFDPRVADAMIAIIDSGLMGRRLGLRTWRGSAAAT